MPNSWNVNFQFTNHTTGSISNVSVEYANKGNQKSTLTMPKMGNEEVSGLKVFSTKPGMTDHWYVSFLDRNGNLMTAKTTLAIGTECEGKTVLVGLYQNYFEVVTPSNHKSKETYSQINP